MDIHFRVGNSRETRGLLQDRRLNYVNEDRFFIINDTVCHWPCHIAFSIYPLTLSATVQPFFHIVLLIHTYILLRQLEYFSHFQSSISASTEKLESIQWYRVYHLFILLYVKYRNNRSQIYFPFCLKNLTLFVAKMLKKKFKYIIAE